MYRTFINVFGVQILSKVIVLLSGVYFARILGPTLMGEYSFLLSIAVVLATVSSAGISQLLIREVTSYISSGNKFKLLGIIKWSSKYILKLSVLLCLLLLLFLCTTSEGEINLIIVLFLLCIPLRANLIRNQGLLNAIKLHVLASFFLFILVPLCVLVFFVLVVVDKEAIVVEDLLLSNILAYLLVSIISSTVVYNLYKKYVSDSKPSYDSESWKSSLIPISLSVIVLNFNNEIAILVLGLMSKPEIVAFFKISTQGMMLLSIGNNAINSILAPRIRKLHEKKEYGKLQVTINKMSSLCFLIGLVFFIVIFLVGEIAVSYIYGFEYLEAINVLTVLCFGQLVNIYCGPVALVLNMTNNEKYTFKAQSFSLVLTIILLIVLIPNFGGIGAAIAVTLSKISWNIIMTIYMIKNTPLRTHALNGILR